MSSKGSSEERSRWWGVGEWGQSVREGGMWMEAEVGVTGPKQDGLSKLKSQGTDSLPLSPEKMQFCHHLDFNPLKPILDS